MPILRLLRYSSMATLFCLALPAWAASIVVQVQDATGKALADVAVYAEPDAGQAMAKPAKIAVIEQKGMKFVPLMTVIQTGTEITFPNNDKVRHHIYSFSPAHKFDQKLYSGTTAAPQLFDKAGTVVLGCNIHDRMIAYIRVVDTPYFAKTDASGAARIDLPASGKFTLKAWHYLSIAGQPAEQAIVVKPGDAPTSASFKLALKPAADGDADAGH